jgi:hypothetical protein
MKKEAPDGLDLGECVREKGCRKHQEGDGSASPSLLSEPSSLLGRAFPAEPLVRIFPVEECRKGLAGGTYALDEKLPLVGGSR